MSMKRILPKSAYLALFAASAILFSALLAALVPNEADATSVIKLSDEQLIEMSDAICHAKVMHLSPIETPDGSILTAVEVEVLDWIKPAQGDKNYTFYMRGGEIGEIRQFVHGEPALELGDEIVVFLEIVPKFQRPLILGLAQGAFIVKDERICRADNRSSSHFLRFMRNEDSLFDKAQTPKQLIDRIRRDMIRLNSASHK